MQKSFFFFFARKPVFGVSEQVQPKLGYSHRRLLEARNFEIRKWDCILYYLYSIIIGTD